jgi:hypothetical protein
MVRVEIERGAYDLQFPKDKVVAESIAGNSYAVEGCGKRQVYNCAASDGYSGSVTNYTCTPSMAADPEPTGPQN